MSHLQFGESRQHSLAVVVETVASPLLMSHPAPVCLEVEIDPAIQLPVDGPLFCQLIDSLIRQSLAEMPRGGELTVTGCQTVTGVDLEIADSGQEVSQRACKLPMVAASMSADIRWQNCPQGGAAVTVSIPFYRQTARRAA